MSDYVKWFWFHVYTSRGYERPTVPYTDGYALMFEVHLKVVIEGVPVSFDRVFSSRN
jgi:hypothetical protein